MLTERLLECIFLWELCSRVHFVPALVYLASISQTWTLNLFFFSGLLEEIVILQITFNNIWEQKDHLLSLFVKLD